MVSHWWGLQLRHNALDERPALCAVRTAQPPMQRAAHETTIARHAVASSGNTRWLLAAARICRLFGIWLTLRCSDHCAETFAQIFRDVRGVQERSLRPHTVVCLNLAGSTVPPPSPSPWAPLSPPEPPHSPSPAREPTPNSKARPPLFSAAAHTHEQTGQRQVRAQYRLRLAQSVALRRVYIHAFPRRTLCAP